jgi:hypothetical protein
MPLSLLCDEHIPYAVVDGLRIRGIDAVSVQGVGLRSAIDLFILDAGGRQGKVIYTCDDDFLRLHNTGNQHAGVFYHHPRKYAIGEAIQIVALACEAFSVDDMRNHVEFL